MLLAILATSLAQVTANPTTTPTDRLSAAWWADRHKTYVERTVKNDFDVAVLGDSITQGWDSTGKSVWNEEFAGLRAANFGCSGDRTQHVLWRLDNGELLGSGVKLVALLIGTNHAGDPKDSAESVAEGVRAIVDRLLARTKAQILIQAIFPRDNLPTAAVRQKNDRVNAIIATFADQKRVHFVDFSSKFLHPDGTLRTLFLPDRLHLSRNGYQLWANGLVPAMRGLLETR